jgi:GT2 family glycosyltransferase
MALSEMLSVEIAIPTLLGGPTLQSCLEALCRQTFRDFEVTVVNNGSDEPIAAPVNFPLRTLSPGANIGFGAAINLAIKNSTAEFIVSLNDDTEPDEHWLERLVAVIRAAPRVGMCASRIQVLGTSVLDSAGMLICGDGSSKQRGQLQPSADWTISGDALLPSGCAGIYRRRMLDEVGLFDEDFFLYCEDTDLGLRARWAGWQCRYVADAVVNHHYSRTAGAFSPLKAKYVERNRLWVAIKNFPASRLLLVPLLSVLRYAWQLRALRNHKGASAGFIRSGNSMMDILAIIWAAHQETAVHLPMLLRKRALCRNRRKIRPAEFSHLLDRHGISARDLAYSG